jgi:ABC-type nickel/cobalt efflux system permease component RcnA
MISRPMLYAASGIILALLIACVWLWWSNRGLERDNARMSDQLDQVALVNQHQAKTISDLHAEIDHRDAAYQQQQAIAHQLRQDLAKAKGITSNALANDHCAHQRLPGAVLDQLRNDAAGDKNGNHPDPTSGVSHQPVQ